MDFRISIIARYEHRNILNIDREQTLDPLHTTRGKLFVKARIHIHTKLSLCLDRMTELTRTYHRRGRRLSSLSSTLLIPNLESRRQPVLRDQLKT